MLSDAICENGGMFMKYNLANMKNHDNVPTLSPGNFTFK